MDNFKAFLIFAVVFGHLLECLGGQRRLWLYFIIYTFHMPAFVFVTGFFAVPNANRIVKKVLYPYFVYQFLYLIFQRYYLRQGNDIQFTTPYWLLWYLLSLFCWMLLLQIIDWSGFQKKWVLIIAILFALLSGFDRSVGTMLSLSRTIVFLPYFILGHYMRGYTDGIKTVSFYKLLISIIIIVISILLIVRNVGQINAVWLYHSVSYKAGEYSIWIRGGLLIIAFSWIYFLLSIIPDKRIRILTALGQYSLPVFLLHGFVVRWIQTIQIFDDGELINLILAFFLALVICVCLGNKWVIKIFGFTFSIK